jgi:ferredoxin
MKKIKQCKAKYEKYKHEKEIMLEYKLVERKSGEAYCDTCMQVSPINCMSHHISIDRILKYRKMPSKGLLL